MRVTAYSIILFFVSLNVSLYLVAETQILPYYQQPYETAGDIPSKLITFDLRRNALLIGGSALVVGIILSWVSGHFIYGGIVALIMFALNLIFPVVQWILYGFPVFLSQIGVPSVIWVSMNALMSVVWFWFIISIIAQRYLET